MNTIKPKEALPFVKWVGGKRGIVHKLIARLPTHFNRYFEPFVGGGALFFASNGRLKKAYLSDFNTDLTISYNVLKKEPEKLLELLREHQQNHSKKHYYKVRSLTSLEDPVQVAARLIYLNRTCYNGLYRTNRKGDFNVPMGSYKSPNIVNEENLWQCHRVLKKATIHYKDFASIQPKRGDFVYFDPPYHPTDEVSFTRYTRSDFTEKDQSRLRDFALSLHRRGIHVMISNSDTAFIHDLYRHKAFKLVLIDAPRLVNCKAEKRKPIKEALITNYPYEEARRHDRKLYGKRA